MEGKICGICGEDCGDRARVKDARGRYFCKSCAEARTAAKRVAALPAPEPLAMPPEIEADPYEIDPGANPFPVEMLKTVEPARSCPVCMRSMGPGAKICVSCGYDADKGIQTSTRVEKTTRKGKRGHFCRECGYDLKGLREPVCPECGTRIKANKHADWDRETERQVIRNEWTKPAVTLGIGLVALCAILGAMGRLAILPVYGMLLGGEIVVGYVVLWISFTFLGDIGTPLLNLLRLAALYTVVDALWFLVSPIPSFWVRTGVPALAYVGLFMNYFDVDWEDAWMVMIINWITKMAIIVAIVMYFAQQ